MRNDEELRRLIHEAADACLSGADAMPSRHDAIMHCIKKEKKVEKPFGIWYYVKGVRNHE